MFLNAMLLSLVAAGAAGYFLYRGLVRRLRSAHFEKWRSLGSPAEWRCTSKACVSLFNFLQSGEYRQLDDPGLSALARWFVVFTAAYLTVLLTIALVLFTSYAK